jgi:hypothetical protein
MIPTVPCTVAPRIEEKEFICDAGVAGSVDENGLVSVNCPTCPVAAMFVYLLPGALTYPKKMIIARTETPTPMIGRA